MSRFVADLGNSRLKWGRLDGRGLVADPVSLPVDDVSAWSAALPAGIEASTWAVASVNPPAASRLSDWLNAHRVARVSWYRSAADVPVRHRLETPDRAGADRAFGVIGSLVGRTEKRPGLVVLCGTAVTVERVATDGVWQGGAIAAGLGLTARALHLLTTQLPLVVPRDAPPSWGSSTLPAIEAGIYWGVVGAVRELLTRQSAGLDPPPWVVWTGGDAPSLAASVAWDGATVVPDLVLRGLAAVAFRDAGG